MRQQVRPVRATFQLATSSAPRRRRVPARTAVASVQVHPEVWQVALQLADGDALRIQVVGAELVTVLNRRR